MMLARCPSAVVFDFDGTLAESRQPIEKEQMERLGALIEHTTVGVMSGSAFDVIEKNFLSHLESNFPKERLFIFPNASSQCFVWKKKRWEIEYNFSLTKEERETVTRALESALEKTGIAEGLPSYGPRIDDRGTEIAFAGLGIEAPLALKEAWDPDKKKRLPFQTLLREKLPDFEVHIGGTTTVEITKKGISKAYGVKWLAKRLETRPDDMLFVGDALSSDGNDAAVIPTGVKTRQVSGPKETAEIIDELCTLCHG